MTFDEFVNAQLRRLLRTAWSICGDHALAEDLVQEVLVNVQRRWDRIEAIERRDAYVNRMLVNAYLSWRRKWWRVTPRASIEPDGVQDDPADAVAERERIRGALAGLPRRQRVVLGLRYYAGLPDAQIAEVMGCAPGTVRGYAARAFATLRQRLGEPEAATSDPSEETRG